MTNPSSSFTKYKACSRLTVATEIKRDQYKICRCIGIQVCWLVVVLTVIVIDGNICLLYGVNNDRVTAREGHRELFDVFNNQVIINADVSTGGRAESSTDREGQGDIDKGDIVTRSWRM